MKSRHALTPLALAAAGMFLLSGCGGSDETVTLDSLAAGWTFESGTGPTGPIEPAPESPITLTIASDGAVSGNTGCNTLVSTVTVDADGKVSFNSESAISTLMACDQAVMDTEFAFTEALAAVTDGSLDGDQLVLTGTDTELRLAKQG